MGSAALDLAWTACGRFDAYYERGLEAWDRAAGELLCARAGLELRELRAHGAFPAGLLAAPAAIAGPLHELVGP
jgi:myo-inositol-1(or 4)-monophosphatase